MDNIEEADMVCPLEYTTELERTQKYNTNLKREMNMLVEGLFNATAKIEILKEKLQGPRCKVVVEDCKKADSPAMIQAIGLGHIADAIIEAFGKENDMMKMVAEFNTFFGHEKPLKPKMLPGPLKTLKFKHLHEELIEYKTASNKGDLEECFDGLIDLVYVALGAAHMHGFDFNEGFRRVHAVNMKKRKAVTAADSKRGSRHDIVKPFGWKPAYLKDLL